MIRILLFLSCIFFYLGGAKSFAQGYYNTSFPQYCSQMAADTALIAFPNALPIANGTGTLRIIYMGDLDAPSLNEKLDIYDENNTLIGTTTPVVQCTGIDTFLYTMAPSIINTMAADSIISFKVIADSGVDPICNPFSFCITPNLTYHLFGSPNDIGVIAIDSPSVFCAGMNRVVVSIENFGSTQVSSCILNWSVNSVLQTPISYTGLLDTFNGTLPYKAQVALGFAQFNAASNNTVDVWTSAPNSQADPISSNDSLSISLRSQLSGTFTVDPLGTGQNNYLTITDVVDDLNTYGVCGPTVINVAAGTYVEQMDFKTISGASSTNTITFKADTAGVTIKYGSTLFNQNFVLKLDGSSWLAFEEITFTYDTSGNQNYRRVVDMNNGSHIRFENCVFDMNNSTINNNLQIGFYAYSNGNNYNKFINNEFNFGGYRGFYFSGYGGVGSWNTGNEFIGNTFQGGYYYGAYISACFDTKFNNNKIIHNSSATTDGYGLHLSSSGNAEINGNYVDYRHHGMHLILDGLYSIVSNNMIHAGLGQGTYDAIGMLLECWRARIVNNTIWVNCGSNNACNGIYHDGGGLNEIFNNNVFRPKGSPSTYGIYVRHSSSFNKSNLDNNNVWAPTGKYGYLNGDKNDLIAWQTTGWGLNSHDANPEYTKKDSMYTCNDTLDNAGKGFDDLLFDFQGDNRHPSTPDIGADEFIGSDSSSFSAGDDGLLCNGNSIEIGLDITGADYIWSNGDTNGTTIVSNEGTYTVSVISACGGSFTDEVEVIDNTPYGSFNVEYGGGKFCFFINNSKRGDSFRWVVYDEPHSRTNPLDTFWTINASYPMSPPPFAYGPYTCLTVYNECDTVEHCQSTCWSESISENILDLLIIVSPNPVSQELTIQFVGIEETEVSIDFINLQGQTAYQAYFSEIQGYSQKRINVSEFKRGMYLVKFTTENGSATKRIVVQ